MKTYCLAQNGLLLLINYEAEDTQASRSTRRASKTNSSSSSKRNLSANTLNCLLPVPAFLKSC